MTNYAVPQRIGNYQLERRIGSGAVSRVWLGRHRTLAHRLCAIKLTQSTHLHELELFNQEAAILSKLDHPGIPRIYDHGYAAPFHYMVLEYINGSTVRQLLQLKRTLGFEQSYHVGQSLADILEYLHKQSIIHRDINPNNIILERDTNRVLLLDFGTAYDKFGTGTRQQLVSLGTPGYIAPEQIANPANATYQSDIFSVGCVLFEMLAGDTPWDNESEMLRVPTLAERGGDNLPVEWDDVFQRMLAHDASQRPSSASESIKEFHRLIERHTAITVTSVAEPDESESVNSTTLHPVEQTLAIDLDQPQLAICQGHMQHQSQHETIAQVLNAWGAVSLWRQPLLGRLAHIQSTTSRNMYMYALTVIQETRATPQTILVSNLDEQFEADPPLSAPVDRWSIELPPIQTMSQQVINGQVVVPGSRSIVNCSRCTKGKRTCSICQGSTTIESNGTTSSCGACNGTGQITCDECNGSGTVRQQQVIYWRRQRIFYHNHDDTHGINPRWINQECTPVEVYRAQEIMGMRPEWKMIPQLAHLIDEARSQHLGDSRVVQSEVVISAIPITDFTFEVGEAHRWKAPFITHTPSETMVHRWSLIGFENKLPPNRRWLDWRMITLISVSGLCFILVVAHLLR
ncbi:MAG: protein kinase domain-containing protein [Roseiflexaceae bacterium]